MNRLTKAVGTPLRAIRARPIALLGVLAAVLLALFAALVLEPAGAASLAERESLDGAQRIGLWLASAERGHQATELAWQRRDGQPPLVGLLQGLSWLAWQDDWGGRSAVAFANLLAGLLTVAFVFAMARRRLGAWAGAAAVVLLLATPGVLSGWRSAGPEPIAAAFLLLVVGSSYLTARRPRTGLLTALVVALAAAAHPIGILLVLPLTLYAAVTGAADDSPRRAGLLRMAPLPLHLLVGLALALLLLVCAWPWLEVQTGKRLMEYLAQSYIDDHPPFLLFGHLVLQARENAPPLWNTPLTWLLRLPLPLLVLAAVGAGSAMRASWRRWHPRSENDETSRERSARRSRRDLLLPLLVIATVGFVQTLNGSPWYDGNDGLQLVAPLLALLAAAGIASCARRLRSRGGAFGRFGPAALVALAALAAIHARAGVSDVPGIYANGLAGGPEGVAHDGCQLRAAPALESPVLRWLNDELPPRARVVFAPETAAFRELARRLRDSGALRDDLYFGELFNADTLVLLYLPGRDGYGQAVAMTSDREPLARVERRGLPLALAYALE